MRKIIKGCVIAVVAILLVATAYIFYCGYALYEETANMCTNERTSDERLIEWLTEDKGFDIEAFKSEYRIEEIELTSSLDGHTIPASYIYSAENADKNADTVVMVHGLLGNRLSNYPMSQMFLALGYNVITYDQRCSGGNTAQHTTFGYLESYDTEDCVSYACEFTDDTKLIGVWGQSMGAATVENAMDGDIFKENVDFVVLDSAMGNMSKILRPRGDELIVAAASLINRINLGFFYGDQHVIKQIEDTEISVLMVSGTKDASIPFFVQEDVYNSIKSDRKMMYSVDDSDHSNIYFEHPDEYLEKLKDFINKFVEPIAS